MLTGLGQNLSEARAAAAPSNVSCAHCTVSSLGAVSSGTCKKYLRTCRRCCDSTASGASRLNPWSIVPLLPHWAFSTSRKPFACAMPSKSCGSTCARSTHARKWAQHYTGTCLATSRSDMRWLNSSNWKSSSVSAPRTAPTLTHTVSAAAGAEVLPAMFPAESEHRSAHGQRVQ